MRHNFSISFYLKQSTPRKNGKYPIMLRITINKEVTDVSLKTVVLPQYWDKHKKRIVKTAPEAQAINTYLDDVYTTLHYYYKQALLSSKHITSNMLKQRFLLIGNTPPTLLKLFMKQKEDACRLFLANKISVSHYNKHKLVYQRLGEFCKKSRINDMPLDQFNRQTIHDLEIFFKADYNLSVNSTAKMLEFIRKGILWAYQCGLILINPFSAYRIKKEDTQVQFLNKQEISRIRKKQLDIPRLDLVRDSFVFSCFTGISYADMCKLTKDQIVFDSKSSGYIHFYRTKTNHPAFIPLLPQSMEILDKYINQNNSGKIFPMLSNQKTNAYLKELADICGIKKKLTYHVARHSFAVTICLENGIPIETLSKILGHTNLRVTQAYAKITHKKVMNDMQALKDRLEY